MISWHQFLVSHDLESRKAAPVFRRALIRHMEKMLMASEQNGFENTIQVIQRIGGADIDQAFQEVYVEAGLGLAFDEYDDLTDKKRRRRRFIIRPDGTKEEIWEKWAVSLKHIALDETIPARGSIMTTSQELFKEIVDQGVQAGQTVDQIAAAVRKKFKTVVHWRSIMIARTESLSAMNYGSQVGADETGFSYEKTWLTFLDGRERQAHAEANNQKVLQHAHFNVGGEAMLFPGDPSASAGNRINCRCRVIREII